MNQFHKVHGLHKQQSTIISKNYKKVVMQYRSGHLQKSIKWKEQTDSENQGETNKIIIFTLNMKRVIYHINNDAIPQQLTTSFQAVLYPPNSIR